MRRVRHFNTNNIPEIHIKVNLLGKEIIKFIGDEMYYKNEFLGLGIQKKYKTYKIKNLRLGSVHCEKYSLFQLLDPGVNDYIRNVITFDYGKRTKHLGFHLSSYEANEVLEKIEEYIERGYFTP